VRCQNIVVLAMVAANDDVSMGGGAVTHPLPDDVNLEVEECSNKQINSMVRVRERTMPTERPPLVGEVVANFCG
jgi:hypothetical protein